MSIENQNQDEFQRRSLQEYIFSLEEVKEEAQVLAIEHDQVKRAQELLNAILGATTHGIALVKESKFVWCNKGLTHILGWKNDELIGKTEKILFSDTETYASMNKSINSHSVKTSVIDFESELLHKDGKRIPCLIAHRPLDTSNLSKGHILSFTDFSERKRAQDALKKAHDELEDRVKERTEELNKINERLKQELSERKRIEASLRESEKRFQQVAENAMEWIWEVDSDGLYTYASPVVEKILGYKPEEIVREKHFYDLFCPDDREELKKAAFEVFAKKQSFREFQNRNVHKNEEEVWLSTSGVAMLDENGNLLGYRGVDTDITERKRAEVALRDSEDRYRTFINSTSDLVFLKDEKFRHIIVNHAYEKFMGRKEQEILGKTDFELLPKDLAETCRQSDLNALDSKGLVVTQEESEERVYESRKFPVSFGDGKLGIGGYLRDITERRRAVEALMESERRYRLLADNVNDVIWIRDLNLSLTYISPSVMNLTGHTVEESMARTLEETLTDESLKVVIERFAEELDIEKQAKGDPSRSLTLELEVNRKDGSTVWTETTTSFLRDSAGEPTAIIGIARDITERRRFEERLRESKKLEAIATLAGGIAHEFNNALFGVTGPLDLLQTERPDNQVLSKYIKPMKNSTQRMANLTNQLLAYARGGKYKSRRICLNDLVEDLLSIIKHRIPSSVLLEADLRNGISDIKGDIPQIQMVLSAVFDNSVEAIEDKGRIRISTMNKEIDKESSDQHPDMEPGSYVCLRVEDSGRGMDKRAMTRLFDPFYTTKFMGRGLGMAAAFGIIKNHNGWIEVDSELGKGTKIHIYLPTLETEVREAERPETALAKGTGTVLVIEDEEMVVEFNRTILEKLGYRVLEAKTGKEAVKLSRNIDEIIDVVMLNIDLPDMGGDMVYQQLIEIRPELKVIVCSGYDIDDPGQKHLAKRVQGFLKKPYSIVTLSEKLKQVLEG